MSWMAAIDFRQGTTHRRDGIPCQDFGRLVQVDENTVLAVLSDGAGSAPVSHLGARSAVESVLPLIRDRLLAAPGRRGKVSELSVEELFDGVVNHCKSAIWRTANDNRRPASDLACTLTVVAIAPNGIAAMQVGDGAVVARLKNETYRLFLSPTEGEYVNETVFVTDTDAEARQQIRALSGPVRFVSAATDGLTRVFVDQRTRQPHSAFFAPIDRFAGHTDSSVEVHRGIREFLASDRLSAQASDDMTLMVCGWQAGME